jgi:hypothetical protein
MIIVTTNIVAHGYGGELMRVKLAWRGGAFIKR